MRSSAGWWRLPDPPLRSRLMLTAFAGLALAGLLSLLVATRIDLDLTSVMVTTVVFAAAMAAAVGAAGARHGLLRVGAANLVTTLRLVLVSLTAGLTSEPVTEHTAWVAIGATAIAALLDGIDGWLARRHGTSSDFGARYDMETDALLILVLSVLVWLAGKAGAWVLACGLMRYVFLAAGWIWPWMARPLTPTVRGKTVAVTQFIGLATALAPMVRPPVSQVIAAGTLVALTWSFATDIARLRSRAADGADGADGAEG